MFLHAAFNKLKADIAVAVKWLRAVVTSLLQDSAKVAREFANLIEQATDYVGDEIATLKATVDTWLIEQEDNVEKLFDRIRAGYPQSATLGTIADFTPATAPAPNRPAKTLRGHGPAAKANDDSTPQQHGDWFLNKVKHSIFGSLNTPEFAGLSYDAVATSLREACDSSAGDLQTAANDFWTFIATTIKHPSEFGAVAVPAFLDAVSKLIQAALKFLKGILDALFDMVAALSHTISSYMLATTIENAGIAGKLLSVAGLGDVKIGTVVNMVFAFPATLAYKIANGPDTRPFGYVPDAFTGVLPDSGTGLGADPSADRALQVTAASVMGVWAGLDTVSSVLEGLGSGVPMLSPAVDTAGPIIVAALAPPFTKDGLPDWRAMSGDTQDGYALGSWLMGLMPAFLAPTSSTRRSTRRPR